VYAADIQREVAEKRRTSDKSTTALLVSVALSRTQPGADASPAAKGKPAATPPQQVPHVSPPSTTAQQEHAETVRKWQAPQAASSPTAAREEPTETTRKWQAAVQKVGAKVNPPAAAVTPPRPAAPAPQISPPGQATPTRSSPTPGNGGFMRRYTLDEFSQMGEPIGSGSYGQVTKVVHKQTAEIFAMKVISKKKVLEHQMTSYLTREVKTQIKVQHPNILRLLYYFEDEANVYLLLEYAKNGSLFSVLRKRGRLPEPEAAGFFVDVASALDYLHKHMVVHRDLKPENILMCDGNIAKLADFGWCAEVSKDGGLRHTFCGTWDYLSPEMVSNEPHDHTVDIWAMGVLLYEMLVGRPPFSASSQIKAMGRITKVDLQIPENISPAARDIISNLIVKERTKRLTLVAAVQHHWVVKYVSNSDSKMKLTVSDLQEGSKKSASAEATAVKRSSGSESVPKPAPKHPGLSAATVAAASKAGLLDEVKKRLLEVNGPSATATALAETRPVSPAVANAATSKEAIAAALEAAATGGLFKGNSAVASARSAPCAVEDSAAQHRSQAVDDMMSKTQPVTRALSVKAPSRTDTQIPGVGTTEHQAEKTNVEDVLSKTAFTRPGLYRSQTTPDSAILDENEKKKEPWQNSKTFADIRKWVRKNSDLTTPLGEELDKTLPLGQAASARCQSDVFSIPVTNTDTLIPLPKRRAASKRRQRMLETADMSQTAPADTSKAKHPSGIGQGCPTPLRERPITPTRAHELRERPVTPTRAQEVRERPITPTRAQEQPASSSLSPLRTAVVTTQAAHGSAVTADMQRGIPQQDAVLAKSSSTAAVGVRADGVVAPFAVDPAATDADKAYQCDIDHMKEDFRGQLERLMTQIDGN